jgi:sulfofructose kinase
VFHGAFCYAVIESMPLREALEFSNAMAALNCTALGARGHIATAGEAKALIRSAQRCSNPEFEQPA